MCNYGYGCPLFAQSGHWPAQRPLCARSGRCLHHGMLVCGEQVIGLSLCLKAALFGPRGL